MKLIVCILDSDVYKKYKHTYDGVPGLSIVYGNIFNHKADAFVTAGNSFGMMDGGIDGHVNYFFDYIQSSVQKELARVWRGECPVGAAVSVTVGENAMGCKYLCYAPTMRTPRNVAKTQNAYLAARGALIECAKYTDIQTIIMPMLCMSVGRMHPEHILHQIKCAWLSFNTPCKCDWFAINDLEMEICKENNIV